MKNTVFEARFGWSVRSFSVGLFSLNIDHNSQRSRMQLDSASSANSAILNSNPFHFELVIFTARIDYFELGCFKLPAISNWVLFPLA